jgi:hypothetical protein
MEQITQTQCRWIIAILGPLVTQNRAFLRQLEHASRL